MLAPEGERLVEFVTHGLSEQERQRIGDPPVTIRGKVFGELSPAARAVGWPTWPDGRSGSAGR
ncbi:hypothetical protein ACPPVT_05020 [Angustibacter sp. McL0619]|uniref:hypothetical protein n=1 Tax=Angustibacter sp. McL0619 TaxID=3415676 RepID=UPI003CF3AA10